jgi:hypothetical protein
VECDDGDARDEAIGHRGQTKEGTRAGIGTLPPTHRGGEKFVGMHAYLRRVRINTARDAADAVSDVMNAVASGQITPSDASEISKMIAVAVKAFETAEFTGGEEWVMRAMKRLGIVAK